VAARVNASSTRPFARIVNATTADPSTTSLGTTGARYDTSPKFRGCAAAIPARTARNAGTNGVDLVSAGRKPVVVLRDPRFPN
jgi:hypothetical protein